RTDGFKAFHEITMRLDRIGDRLPIWELLTRWSLGIVTLLHWNNAGDSSSGTANNEQDTDDGHDQVDMLTLHGQVHRNRQTGSSVIHIRESRSVNPNNHAASRPSFGTRRRDAICTTLSGTSSPRRDSSISGTIAISAKR